MTGLHAVHLVIGLVCVFLYPTFYLLERYSA